MSLSAPAVNSNKLREHLRSTRQRVLLRCRIRFRTLWSTLRDSATPCTLSPGRQMLTGSPGTLPSALQASEQVTGSTYLSTVAWQSRRRVYRSSVPEGTVGSHSKQSGGGTGCFGVAWKCPYTCHHLIGVAATRGRIRDHRCDDSASHALVTQSGAMFHAGPGR